MFYVTVWFFLLSVYLECVMSFYFFLLFFFSAGTQFVIGFLTFALGIVARVEFNENYWVNISYGGIWSGVFIGFAAVFSFLSSVKPNSPQVNIANLIFSLLATASAVFNGILSTIALRYVI